MKKLRSPAGLIAYKTTTEEIYSIGGLGICDDCGTFRADGGYLVPVLNHWMCEECFNDWSGRAKFYPEDAKFELKTAEYYEARIPITDWPKECKDCPCSFVDGEYKGQCAELTLQGKKPCESVPYLDFNKHE